MSTSLFPKLTAHSAGALLSLLLRGVGIVGHVPEKKLPPLPEKNAGSLYKQQEETLHSGVLVIGPLTSENTDGTDETWCREDEPV